MAVVMALTGEPGAGKSTAARWFVEQGAKLLDADAMVRELWGGEDLPNLARERWGDAVFCTDGSVDKKAISRIIFSDEKEYAWLCGIIYPIVLGKMAAALPRDGIVIAEIPMLFEIGRPEWVARVLFMYANGEKRAERNSFRGLDDVELARREKFFKSREERAKKSDWALCNDGSIDALKEKLRGVWAELKNLEAARASKSEIKGDSIK